MRNIDRGTDGCYSGIWDGKQIRYPSVTTALGALTDFSQVAPDILERAAKFGTAVHSTIELYETNRLDRETLDPILETILAAWETTKTKYGILVRKAEIKVVSNKYRYAGTLDLIADVRAGNGMASGVIEVKSRPYNAVTEPLQTAAYFQAYRESYPEDRITRRWFCGFDLNGGCRFFEIKRGPGQPDHLDLFLSVLAIHKWRKGAK